MSAQLKKKENNFKLDTPSSSNEEINANKFNKSRPNIDHLMKKILDEKRVERRQNIIMILAVVGITVAISTMFL